MMGKRECIRDIFSAALAVWIAAVGVITPSLDRDLLGSELSIASVHNETCAHPHHDHTFCIQFGKQRWSKGSSVPPQMLPPVTRESVSVRDDAPVEALRRIRNRSRAPPHTT